jgi:hypothetical protein
LSEAGGPARFGDTWLARILFGWMGVAVLLAIGLGPLSDWLRWNDLTDVLIKWFVFPAAFLIALAWIARARDPSRYRPALRLVMGFCVAYVLAVWPLITAGAWLNFQVRRPTYERIIADAEAGRIPLDNVGNASGRRDGVTYWVKPTAPRLAQFGWGSLTVYYDEWECYGRRRPDAKPLALPPSDSSAPPMIKNAGRLGGLRWPLSHEACLMSIVL